MLSARLRNWPQTGIPKEGNQKLQHDGVASSDRVPLQVLADHKVISLKLFATGARNARDWGGRVKTKAKPSSQAKVIIGQAQLRSRRSNSEPVGRPCLSQAKEMRRQSRVGVNSARNGVFDSGSDRVLQGAGGSASSSGKEGVSRRNPETRKPTVRQGVFNFSDEGGSVK